MEDAWLTAGSARAGWAGDGLRPGRRGSRAKGPWLAGIQTARDYEPAGRDAVTSLFARARDGCRAAAYEGRAQPVKQGY
jgi:hypothetical protein